MLFREAYILTDVYLTYHESSKEIADKITARLKKDGIGAVSSDPGKIKDCKVFIILLNQAASYSKEILDEISTACVRYHGGEDIAIMPFQVSDETVSPEAMSYIGKIRWTEAYEGDMDFHIDRLAKNISSMLGTKVETKLQNEEVESKGENLYTASDTEKSKKTPVLGIVIGCVIIIALVAFGLVYANKSKNKPDAVQEVLGISTQDIAARYGVTLDGNEAWEENGVTMIGKKVNGTIEGNGIKLYPNGSTYIGAFKNVIAEGYDIFTFADSGSVYYGEWADNYRNGKGKFVKKDGETWEGTWVNDYENGDFTITYADGTVEKYVFKDGNGELVE